MKKTIFAAAMLAAVAFAPAARADLDGFLRNVDVRAKADIRDFNVKLSAQFGVPVPRVEAIVRSVDRPSDAFMVLHVGQMTRTEPDRVLRTYQANKGKGWGVMAQRMGIKPGSAEFHALKRGDLAFTGQPGGGSRHGHEEREHGRGEHGPGMGRGGKGH